MSTIATIRELFERRGASGYGFEAVTQLEHALQAAHFAERDGAPAELVAAALLHDVGHLLHDLPDDAPQQGIDDRHEATGHQWLQRYFPPGVTEPVRLHVDAKRYLCAVEPGYHDLLSPPSQTSLALQGGVMSANEANAFTAGNHCEAAVRLRRWDDAAKVVGLKTAPLDHFLQFVERCCNETTEPPQ